MNTKVWQRADLKERAQEAFKRNYWWCVLAGLILMLLTSSGNGRDNDNKKNKEDNQPVIAININDLNLEKEDIEGYVEDYVTKAVGGHMYTAGKAIYGIVGGVIGLLLVALVLAVLAIAILLRALLFNPLEVGGRKFFLENALTKQDGIGDFLYAFKSGYYGNITVAMFVRDVKIFLWTLLLIVPGIIKAYEYRMVPYILSENPEIGYNEALNRSSEMMNGQKMNAFLLDLSFIGWEILSAITAGIAGIFWVNPYVFATDAELYLELSDVRAEAA